MQKDIYYVICEIMWKNKKSKGHREIWVISEYTTTSDLQKNKLSWIKNHYFKNSRIKPDVLVTDIISTKKIGVTSRPEYR